MIVVWVKNMFKGFIVGVLTIPRRVINAINIKRKHCSCGHNLKINGILGIHGTGNITLGDNVTINSSGNSNPSAGYGKTHLSVYGNGRIIIGNNVGISNSAITSESLIEIEDDVMIGSGCMIADTDFHSVDYSNRIKKPDVNVKRLPIRIRKGAFIGARSIVLKGVTIGERSVIGAGSVVTKDIPDDEIWAGNPAVCIKKQ